MTIFHDILYIYMKYIIYIYTYIVCILVIDSLPYILIIYVWFTVYITVILFLIQRHRSDEHSLMKKNYEIFKRQLKKKMGISNSIKQLLTPLEGQLLDQVKCDVNFNEWMS